ncbi:hypothetical protein OROMI_028062 [Orobanche minor]
MFLAPHLSSKLLNNGRFQGSSAYRGGVCVVFGGGSASQLRRTAFLSIAHRLPLEPESVATSRMCHSAAFVSDPGRSPRIPATSSIIPMADVPVSFRRRLASNF